MRLDLEEWRYLASPFYDVVRTPEHQTDGVVADALDAHGLLLTKVSTPTEILIHDPLTRKAVCHDYLLFEQFYSGGGNAEVGSVEFSVYPDRLHFIDMSRYYVSMKSASVSEGVLIPHQMVGYDPSIDEPYAAIELSSSQGQLLATAHRLMRSQINDADPDGADFVETFLELVQRFMLRRGPGIATSPSEKSVLALLLDYIFANLSDPDLSTEKIMVVFGISRSALYRHFEEHGGVERYIRNRRLDRCMSEFVSSEAGRGKISTVARRWNFHDATHFNRIFRARFGETPSGCIGRGQEILRVMPKEVATVAHGWVDGLSSSKASIAKDE